MDCPHCGKAFHDEWVETPSGKFLPDSKRWQMRVTVCPACSKETVELQKVHYTNNNIWELEGAPLRSFPSSTFRKPTPPEVPANIKADYEDACKVLQISSKASAALSGRLDASSRLGSVRTTRKRPTSASLEWSTKPSRPGTSRTPLLASAYPKQHANVRLDPWSSRKGCLNAARKCGTWEG